MRVLVTVGTTRFDALIDAILSPPFLHTASAVGVERLTVQHGHSPITGASVSGGPQVDCLPFIPDIDQVIAKADIVIGHCGSGTILDALRGPIFPIEATRITGKARPRLILVPNPSLMDNHQQELARQMHALGAAVISSPADLCTALRQCLQTPPVPLPPPNVQALNDAVVSLLEGRERKGAPPAPKSIGSSATRHSVGSGSGPAPGAPGWEAER